MDFLQTVVNGLLLGGLYGLFGLGAAIAVGVAKIVNVAHGEFIVASAYIGVFLLAWLGINPWILLVLVAIIVFGIGYVFQWGLLNRVMAKDPLPALLVTFGVSIMLRNFYVAEFGANIRSLDVGNLRYAGFDFLGLRWGTLPVIVFGISTSLFLILHFALGKTAFGRVLRATADNFEIVQLFGVNYRRIFNIAMGLALAMSAVAGMMLAMRTAFSPFSGADRLLISFEVVIVGGLGSLWGALIGGFVLGLANIFGLQFDPNSGLLYTHLTFFIILMILPQGLSAWRR